MSQQTWCFSRHLFVHELKPCCLASPLTRHSLRAALLSLFVLERRVRIVCFSPWAHMRRWYILRNRIKRWADATPRITCSPSLCTVLKIILVLSAMYLTYISEVKNYQVTTHNSFFFLLLFAPCYARVVQFVTQAQFKIVNETLTVSVSLKRLFFRPPQLWGF